MAKCEYNLKVVLLSNNKYGEGLDNLAGANYITNELYNYFESIVLDPINDILLLQDVEHTEAVNNLFSFIDKVSDQNTNNNVFFIFVDMERCL